MNGPSTLAPQSVPARINEKPTSIHSVIIQCHAECSKWKHRASHDPFRNTTRRAFWKFLLFLQSYLTLNCASQSCGRQNSNRPWSRVSRVLSVYLIVYLHRMCMQNSIWSREEREYGSEDGPVQNIAPCTLNITTTVFHFSAVHSAVFKYETTQRRTARPRGDEPRPWRRWTQSITRTDEPANHRIKVSCPAPALTWAVPPSNTSSLFGPEIYRNRSKRVTNSPQKKKSVCVGSWLK